MICIAIKIKHSTSWPTNWTWMRWMEHGQQSMRTKTIFITLHASINLDVLISKQNSPCGMLYFDVILECLLNGYLDYDHNADDSNDDSDSDHDDLPDL